MLERLDALLTAIHLYLVRRHQPDNKALRRYFKDKYDIDVGLNSYGCFDPWRMPGPMRVGRYCSIAGTVRSARENHPTAALTTYPSLYQNTPGVPGVDHADDTRLVIEDDVWIGHNVIILPGCNYIGRGAVVGAGAILTQDVAAYTIVAGNPARKLRDRFDPALAAAIDASGWWKLELEELGRLAREHPDLVFRPSVEGFEQWERISEAYASTATKSG